MWCSLTRHRFLVRYELTRPVWLRQTLAALRKHSRSATAVCGDLLMRIAKHATTTAFKCADPQEQSSIATLIQQATSIRPNYLHYETHDPRCLLGSCRQPLGG